MTDTIPSQPSPDQEPTIGVTCKLPEEHILTLAVIAMEDRTNMADQIVRASREYVADRCADPTLSEQVRAAKARLRRSTE